MQTIIYQSIIETPLRPMIAFASPKGLCAFEFVEGASREQHLLEKLKARFGNIEIRKELSAILQTTKQWLDEYFSGNEPTVSVPLDIVGDPFEESVWQHLLPIPFGAVISYGDIAKKLGDIGLSRAVGRAVGHNPIPIIIPCHRVMGSNGHLTGYSGGIEKKKWLLAHEGYSLFF